MFPLKKLMIYLIIMWGSFSSLQNTFSFENRTKIDGDMAVFVRQYQVESATTQVHQLMCHLPLDIPLSKTYPCI